MLQSLRLGPAHVERTESLPPLLAPLVHAAESGSDLIPHVESLTRQFGFDSFTYRVATSLRPDQENQIFEFTILPAVWAIRYDQNAYIEVDPRVIGTCGRTVPMLWDQPMLRGSNSKVHAFLNDALSHGIASGVCIPLYDEHGTNALIDFSSTIPILELQRESEIQRVLSDMYIFSRYFHEVFKRAAFERRIPARNAGMSLSPRERECLALAARGIASDAIGQQLGIDLRLIQIHFDSIRSKLGVTNLREAIARAARDGIPAL